MTIAVSGRGATFAEGHRTGPQADQRAASKRLTGLARSTLVGGAGARCPSFSTPKEWLATTFQPEDVRVALARQNLEVPGGRMDQGSRELQALRTLGRLQTEKEFNDLIVANRNGYPHPRHVDIGRAEDAFEEPRTMGAAWAGDQQLLSAWWFRSSPGVNTVKVVEARQGPPRSAQARTSPDITTEVIRDQSRFIKKSIEEVKFHLLLRPPFWCRPPSCSSSATGVPR